MKNIVPITKVLAKILEVSHWVAMGLMAAVAVCSAAAPQWLDRLIDVDTMETGGEISVYGFEAAIANADGSMNMKLLLLFAIGAVIIFSLVAMLFRNLYLIVKRSETGSPFQKDNIRMLKEMGIFSISIPVVGLIMNIIIRLVVSVEAELSVGLDGFVMGIFILCLTQFFAYGAALEKDTDGLV